MSDLHLSIVPCLYRLDLTRSNFDSSQTSFSWLATFLFLALCLLLDVQLRSDLGLAQGDRSFLFKFLNECKQLAHCWHAIVNVGHVALLINDEEFAVCAVSTLAQRTIKSTDSSCRIRN